MRWAIGRARRASVSPGQLGRYRLPRLEVGPEPDRNGQPPADPTEPVAGQVHSHAPHPRLGGAVPAQPRPADRGSGQRLLDDVLGVLEVAGDQVELADQAVEHRRVEVLELAFVPQTAPSGPGGGHASLPRWSTGSGSLT